MAETVNPSMNYLLVEHIPYLFSNRINTEYDCMIIDGETLGEGDLIMAAAKETVQN